MPNLFADPPALCGPLRRPRQMRETGCISAVMMASWAAYDREAAELGRGA